MCDPFTAIMVGSQALKGIGSIQQGLDTVQESGRRAGQIEFDTQVRTEQTRQRADRRRGATRAAFAKSGVKAKGSAARLIEEQAKQDDLELLKIQTKSQFAIASEIAGAEKATRQASQGVIGSVAGGFDILDRRGYFDLGD